MPEASSPFREVLEISDVYVPCLSASFSGILPGRCGSTNGRPLASAEPFGT